MKKIGHVTLLVKNYDEAIEFYTKKAGFVLLTDNAFGGGMRWVTVAPAQDAGTAIVFVEADTADKVDRVGSQAAGHVFLTVQTEDCYRDYEHMKANGSNFSVSQRKCRGGSRSCSRIFTEIAWTWSSITECRNAAKCKAALA
ncbi:VOC family protein [Paenibacillus macerans]|uniref:VOC family protein n=1 Tax=Paenibacillus macerans TaxID=44252 RepID=UPI001F0FD646|nr:VOC family protein [Paenibacillus macerans]MEC0135366.1 VOC family protein [Paenibacillus macerans]UMV50070.1 VOC family protein [Paenibacillus macerans]